jgi:hypothetical protein
LGEFGFDLVDQAGSPPAGDRQAAGRPCTQAMPSGGPSRPVGRFTLRPQDAPAGSYQRLHAKDQVAQVS